MSSAYILVVDDNPDSRDILGTALTLKDYEIGYAVDGVEALKSMYQRRPDVILLDLMMPNMNGFEVLHRMQMDSKMRHIPVVVVSAVGDEGLLHLPGVKHVIRKSAFTIPGLQDTVEELLENLPSKSAK